MTVDDLMALLNASPIPEDTLKSEPSSEPASALTNANTLAAQIATLKRELEIANLRVEAVNAKMKLGEKIEVSNAFRKRGIEVSPDLTDFELGRPLLKRNWMSMSLEDLLGYVEVFNAHLILFRELTQLVGSQKSVDDRLAEKKKDRETSAQTQMKARVANEAKPARVKLSPKEKFVAGLTKIGISAEIAEQQWKEMENGA